MRPDWRHPQRAAASSAAFAAAIAERHGIERLSRGALGAERVLHFSAPASIVTHVRQSFALRLSPHIQLSVQPAQQSLLQVPGAAPVVFRDAPPAMQTLHHEAFTTRLMARETRHSSFDVRSTERVLHTIETGDRRDRAGDAAPAGSRPSTRVFARPPAAPKPVSSTPVPAVEQDRLRAETPWRAELKSVPGAAHPGQAAIDVNHLTREVMRGIDERILAHRERLGRG